MVGAMWQPTANESDSRAAPAYFLVQDPPQPTSGPGDEADEEAMRAMFEGPYRVEERKLTNKEISRIRYMELRGMRMRTTQPDRVTVKVPREIVDEFLVSMEGHPDFAEERNRRDFLKQTPPQKLHAIAFYKREEFADKVEILTDPEVYAEFKRNVLPPILRSCATSGCHGPGAPVDQVKFRLFKDPKKTNSALYGNFILLNELGHKGRPLINRAQVSNSLMLTYLLPESEVRPELRHPGNIKLKPLFRSRSAMGFKRIEAWIASLRNPPSDYGVHLVHRGETDAPPGPGDQFLP
ncbi:hypothetical protein RAS2_17110 [Phycisphaerae bacterium RAS2]|nr:hypothetical protein RAS2_17110 [Phycisphaerae bacterium RAS2]